MVKLELREYEARCAVAHLTQRKDDITAALQSVGHLLDERGQNELKGDIAQISTLCEYLTKALTEAVD